MSTLRCCVAAMAAALAATAAAGQPTVFLEVHNTGPRRFQHVVEHRAEPKQLFPDGVPAHVRVVETDPSGTPIAETVGQFDVEDATAVLSLLLSGVTHTGARRHFLVSAADEAPAAPTDLRCETLDGEFRISNHYYAAHVASKGRGGFPGAIVLSGSGNRYGGFLYGDRVYSKERGSLHLRDDPASTARLVARGPLRVVVEATARYGPPHRYASGNATAIYRYVYRADSPVVDVACKVARTDDYPWREIHFLQVSRQDTRLTHWLGGQPPQNGAFLNSKTSANLPRWGVMHNVDDAIGLAHPNGVILYDGIDYMNYLQTPVITWTKRTYENAGRLYFGPALGDAARYADFLAPKGAIQTRVRPLPAPAAPRAAAAKYALEHPRVGLRLEFADEAAGLGLARIVGSNGPTALVRAADPKPLLWRVELRSPTKGAKPITIDNRVPAKCSARATATKLELRWDAIALDGQPDALSVRATIDLRPDQADSAWRIAVDNRSTRYGVWDVFFPVLASVSPDAAPDVAVPRSNWGMLYRATRQALNGWYPCCNWPMQFLCIDGAADGLALACHDPEAWPKRFALTPGGEFRFQIHAPHQGVPARNYEQPFPIALANDAGSWWNGARAYRRWAVAGAPWTRKGPLATRKDTPRKLLGLGLWMLGGGHPREVVPRMHQAAELFGIPIGIHWYNWHEIPFDTYYPNYFPTKPGFAEAVKELTAKGMVVMPYINGRLWDSGNENFKAALPFACKSTQGKPYIELYGSKRPLAVMCPATRFWQDKVHDICRRLMTDCGVNAIYIDQIAAAGPRLCYDTTHGHPLGGGAWWVDGYRKMLTRINAIAHADGRDVVITTENNTECYMDNADAFLTWNPRYDHEIPMMTAVYSGYTTYFSSPSNVNDTLTAFSASQGRDFLFGCQLGWMGWGLLEPGNRPKALYLRDLARRRLAAAEFMTHGELVGELKPTHEIPSIEVTWGRNRPHTAVLPAVAATVWRSRGGHLAIAATNWDDQPHAFRYALAPSAWGGRTAEDGAVALHRLTLDGRSLVGYARGESFERTEMLRPREVLVLAVRPAPSPNALLDELAAQIQRAYRRARLPKLTGTVQQRCQALLAVSGSPKAMMEPLGMRQAKHCALDLLMADLGLHVSVESARIVAAAGHAYRVKAVVANTGRQRRQGICSLMGNKAPYNVAPGARAEVELAARAPHLPDADEFHAFETVRCHPSADERSPALAIPIAVATVRPLTVRLQTGGSPRAGEDLLVRATVSNHTSLPASPTVALRVPAGWQVLPSRSVRLAALKGGEQRTVAFLCGLPRAAAPGRAAITASISLAEQSRHVDVAPPRPAAAAPHRNGAPTIDGDLADWAVWPPIALEGRGCVRIDGWNGPADCSARLWAGWNTRHLFIAADVRDDRLDQKQAGFAIWQGDCIQVALCPGPPRSDPGYGGVAEFGLALTPKGPQVFQWLPQARDLAQAKLVVTRADGRLRYEAAIPWASLGPWRPTPDTSLGWSFTVNDADGAGFEGWLEWTPGICGSKDAAHFGRLTLEPPRPR